MANHRAAAALLRLIAPLLVAVALSEADARPTLRHHDEHVHERGSVADHAGAPTASEPVPTCTTCEAPEPQPKPEPEELACNKVHAVNEGETCYSVGECAGLGLDDFLRFNPNICCDKLFVGQWVCLDATTPC